MKINLGHPDFGRYKLIFSDDFVFCGMNVNLPGVIKIEPSTLNDLDDIFFLFDQAIAYQRRNNYNLWPRFSAGLIINEIALKQHWKVMHNDRIVCVFSVQYQDPLIWKELDIDPAVYLHRIAVHPLFKGNKMMLHIKNWAMQHARDTLKEYVRMDTWGNNLGLRAYYQECGFKYHGQQHLDQTEPHYGGAVLSLFQLKV